MKKFIATVLVVVMCVCMLTACGEKESKGELDAAKKAGKLIIGVTEYDPMNYMEGGVWVGFDTEYAEAVCAKLGIKAEFQVIDWDSKEALLKGGNIDCIWNGFTVTEDRKANVDFTDTYLLNKQVVVINSANADKFTSLESLKGALLTAEAESAGEAAIIAAKIDQNYTASAKQMDGLTAVLAGNFDAVVLDYTLALANCGKGDFQNLCIAEGITLENEQYAIGFRQGSDLVAEVNKATEELVKDGTLAKIAEKYGLTDLYNEAHK